MSRRGRVPALSSTLVTGPLLILAPFDLAEPLSELLDLPLAGEQAAGRGHVLGRRPQPRRPKSLPAPTAPETYTEHERPLVDGVAARGGSSRARCMHTGWTAWRRPRRAWARRAEWGDYRLAVAASPRDPEAVPLLLAEADLS